MAGQGDAIVMHETCYCGGVETCKEETAANLQTKLTTTFQER